MMTPEQLDNTPLPERVRLAQQGTITWDQVNRPEADARMYAEREANRPVHERLAQAPLVRSSQELRERRLARRHQERNRRKAFYEMMLEVGVDMLKTVPLPEMPAHCLATH